MLVATRYEGGKEVGLSSDVCENCFYGKPGEHDCRVELRSNIPTKFPARICGCPECAEKRKNLNQ